MGAAPLSWLAKIGGDTLKTKAKLLSSAINELYDNVVKKIDIVGLDYIKAATADDLKNKVPEANAVKELNSNLTEKIVVNHYDLTFNNGICNIEGGQYNVVSVVPIGVAYTCGLYIVNLSPITYAVKIKENETYSGTITCRIVYIK